MANNERIDVIEEARRFIPYIKPGRTGRFPYRLSTEERDEVKNEMRGRGIRGLGFTLNPTEEGGGTIIHRPNNKRRR